MKPDRWQDIERIYNAALEREPDSRGAFLQQACGGDEALRRDVESLLGYEPEPTSHLGAPVRRVLADKIAEGGGELTGRQMGNYKVLSRLGAGGMGEVYLAQDTRLGRKVAIKFLAPELAGDERARRRLLREARSIAALDHPNICPIYEVAEEDGTRFIVMQYVEGETLAVKTQRKPLELRESVDIAVQVADALSEANARGIVHRDIKPQNIMVSARGKAKVMDFGLAKIIEQSSLMESEAETQSLLTEPGMIIGTIPYMSPEQVRGEALDARSDIFSFGAVLYEMISGRQPFAAESAAATASAILAKEPLPVARFAPEAPEELQRIVRKCLEKDREQRYQAARELLIDLHHLQKESGRTPETALKSVPEQHRIRHRYALAAAALLIFAIAGSWVYLSTTKTKGISSIAVLPFANIDADPDTEYLSDGITDNIIERLSQLDNLKVTSHTAVFHYKGREIDAQAIGRELGVEALLTGRVVKRSDALTINLELVDARNNTHIWGEQYDRKLSDLLAVQREIPVDVSDKLRLRLSGESKERLARVNTSNPEAYQLYLKGRYSWERFTQDGARQAVDYFEEAIKKDPTYAAAYSGLADAYLFGQGAGAGLPQKEAHRRARDAAMKALALNPTLGEAHASLAEVLLYDDWDFAGAEKEFKRSIELSPSYAEGRHQYSHLLLAMGRIDESFAESKKFLELDPVSESSIAHLGYHYLFARQYDDAIKQYQKNLQLYPGIAIHHSRLGDAYYQEGMFREAVEEYLKALALSGFASDKIAALRKAFDDSGIKGYLQARIEQLKTERRTPIPDDDFNIARLYAQLGEKDQAFDSLEKAYAEHSDRLVHLKEEIMFDKLSSDPRLQDLLRRVGLPQ